MNIMAPTPQPERFGDTEEIPVIDISALRAGAPGAVEDIGAQVRHALENIGFYYIAGHGIDTATTDGAFSAAKQFSDLPTDRKMELESKQHNIGYKPARSRSYGRSSIQSRASKPSLNEAFFIKRDLPPGHPDVLAQRPFRGLNKWPADLPGFRDSVLTYLDAVEALAKSLLPAYARALDMPADFFDEHFREPMYTLRLAFYPAPDVIKEGDFGLPPHADTSFMTLLAPNPTAGLEIRLPTGRWVNAPFVPGAFLVNGGDMLRRWTNDRFLATPHRVINRTGGARYAVPFFFDCDINTVMAAIPSCVPPGTTSRYDPVSYTDYMTWYLSLKPEQASDGATALDG